MLYDPQVLYLEINIISIVLLAIITVKSTGSDLIPRWEYFCTSIFLMIINIASDTIWQLMDTGRIGATVSIDIFVKSIYFLSLTATCYMWVLFSESLRKAPFSSWKTSITLAGSLLYFHAFLLCINPFTGILFSVSDSLFYSRGKFFLAQYLLPFTYLTVASVRSFLNIARENSFFEKNSFFAYSVCPLLPVVCSILQIRYRRLPLLAPGFGISMFILYSYLVESGVKYDPLTGLPNRRILFHTIAHDMKNPSVTGLYLFMIDVDFFKTINDSFGHVQGDMALKKVAEILESGIAECGKRALAARYGGDEFTIILQSESSSENNRISARIQRLISMSNKSGDHIYNLSLSIGCVRYDPLTTHTVRELVNAADSVLYLVKKQRHIQRL